MPIIFDESKKKHVCVDGGPGSGIKGHTSGVLSHNKAEHIANAHMGVKSLKETNSGKDFHSLHVLSIKHGLQAAYKAGGGKGQAAHSKLESIAKARMGISSLTPQRLG